MGIENKVKEIFKDVLDIPADEIKPNEPLDVSLGMDSTEMVEITVAIKKEFSIADMENSDLKKNFSFNQIVAFLKGKGAAV